MDNQHRKIVAPRTGAWIETPIAHQLSGSASSRPARARGLKHGISLIAFAV